MMILCVLLLISTLNTAGALVQWRFQNVPVENGWEAVLNAEIGTPGQSVPLKLSQDSRKNFLGVPSTINNYGGSYTPSASSTFKKTSIINNKDSFGMSGTDNFVIGGFTLENMPFNVYEQGKYFEGFGSLSLAYSNDTNSNFIQALLKTQGQKTAIISYDSMNGNDFDHLNGTLTLGGQSSECSTNWTHVKKVPYKDGDLNWSFKANFITAGRYQKRNPGTIKIDFTDEQFYLQRSTSDTLSKALGSKNGWDIPCNTTTKIVLNVARIDLEIGPETYLYPIDPDTCILKALDHDDTADANYFGLPTSVLKDLCIVYNYETLEIGLAPRLK